MGLENKEKLKQVGKTIGLSTAIGTGIGTAGALINKKNKKKKGEDLKMNKEAFNIVNNTFEKLADFAMKDMLSDEAIKKMKEAAGDYKSTLKDFETKVNGTNFNDKMKNIKEKAPDMQGIKDMASNLKKKGLPTKSKVAIGAGVGTAAIAGGALAYNKLKKKKEKTAFEIVNDTFQKIAEVEDKKKKQPLSFKDVLPMAGATSGVLAGTAGASGLYSAMKSAAKSNPDFLPTLKRETKGLGKEVAKVGGAALIPTTATAAALVTASKGINKLKQNKEKKEEKTASEIVDSVFGV